MEMETNGYVLAYSQPNGEVATLFFHAAAPLEIRTRLLSHLIEDGNLIISLHTSTLSDWLSTYLPEPA